MKVLFLDIDGVVNNRRSAAHYSYRGAIGIDPHLAFLVGKLVMDTDIKVVLSSSWRHWPEGREEIRKQVVDFIDITPTLPRPPGMGRDYCERGREIKAWLDGHPEVTKYAIVDDDNDMLPEQQKHFFKTSFEIGITQATCDRIKRHLADKKKYLRNAQGKCPACGDKLLVPVWKYCDNKACRDARQIEYARRSRDKHRLSTDAHDENN
jgi:hypothetical protein